MVAQNLSNFYNKCSYCRFPLTNKRAYPGRYAGICRFAVLMIFYFNARWTFGSHSLMDIF